VEPFDSTTMSELTERAKQQLRARMRGLRGAYPRPALAEASRRIVQSIVDRPEFARAGGVGLFWPLLERGEVDTRSLLAQALERGKRVYYPCMEPTRPDGFETGFGLTLSEAELADRGQRFWEPQPGAPRASRHDIDLLVVPALAVAANGHRLGYGSGFYDATLGDHRPPALAIVVAYEFQLLAELPATEHDVACDLVITEKRVIEVAHSKTQKF
jgi:5-formyltetrahydrofolate cyclo-ligase